jgi:RHS repeat-associated protein
VTDGSGNLVASYVYEGFGKVVGQSDGGGGPYQFCGLWGYRNDQDAGLLHVGARYYEVETGRWVQKDPILSHPFIPQVLNSYSYVANNPINGFDPLGESCLLLIGCVIVVVGLIVTLGFFIYIGLKVIKERKEKQMESAE